MAGPRPVSKASDALIEKRERVEAMELDARYHEARLRVLKAKSESDAITSTATA